MYELRTNDVNNTKDLVDPNHFDVADYRIMIIRVKLWIQQKACKATHNVEKGTEQAKINSLDTYLNMLCG